MIIKLDRDPAGDRLALGVDDPAGDRRAGLQSHLRLAGPGRLAGLDRQDGSQLAVAVQEEHGPGLRGVEAEDLGLALVVEVGVAVRCGR